LPGGLMDSALVDSIVELCIVVFVHGRATKSSRTSRGERAPSFRFVLYLLESAPRGDPSVKHSTTKSQRLRALDHLPLTRSTRRVPPLERWRLSLLLASLLASSRLDSTGAAVLHLSSSSAQSSSLQARSSPFSSRGATRASPPRLSRSLPSRSQHQPGFFTNSRSRQRWQNEI